MRFLAYIILSFTALTLGAVDKPFAPVIEWSGYQAKAVSAPKVSAVKGPHGKNAVRIEATSAGKYQGAIGKFTPPVDFGKYSAIEFYVRHNISGKGMTIFLESQTGRVHGKFASGKGQKWSKVVIPLDKDSFTAQRGNTVTFSETHSMRITPYANMSGKGKFMEFADFKLLPKTSGTRQLKFM